MSHGGYTYKVQRKNACQGTRKKKQPGEVPNGDSDLARMNGRFNCRHEETNISINGPGVTLDRKNTDTAEIRSGMIQSRSGGWRKPARMGVRGETRKSEPQVNAASYGASRETRVLKWSVTGLGNAAIDQHALLCTSDLK